MNSKSKNKRKILLVFFSGFFVVALLIFSGDKGIQASNLDEFCASFHKVHPHSITSWKMSTHYNNKRGIVVHFVGCHPPTEGHGRFVEKAKNIDFGKDFVFFMYKLVGEKASWMPFFYL